MKIRILFAILLASCLTSCASYYGAITQTEVHRIQPGATTEADLVKMFGPPDTRIEAHYGAQIQLDWFRSVAPGPGSYVPIVGQFLGGLNIDVQQLTVLLGRDGRVLRYQIYDSNAAVRTEKVQTQTRVDRGYSK